MGFFDKLFGKKTVQSDSKSLNQPNSRYYNEYVTGENRLQYSFGNGVNIQDTNTRIRADKIELSIDAPAIRGRSDFYYCTLNYKSSRYSQDSLGRFNGITIIIGLDRDRMSFDGKYAKAVFDELLNLDRMIKICNDDNYKVGENMCYAGSAKEINGEVVVSIDQQALEFFLKNNVFSSVKDDTQSQIAELQELRSTLIDSAENNNGITK